MVVLSAHLLLAADVDLPGPDTAEAIIIDAEAGNRWNRGEYEVWVLRGNCRISQGTSLARADEAVLWIEHAMVGGRRRSKIIAYLEGEVDLRLDPHNGPARLTDNCWLGRFYASGPIQIGVLRAAGKPQAMPAVFQRGMERRRPLPAAAAGPTRSPHAGVRNAQFIEPPIESNDQVVTPSGTRRIRVFPRGNVPVQAQWFPDPGGNQWIAVIDSGVNLIVDGLPAIESIPVGSIDVSADRLVIWTRGLEEPDLTGQRAQDERVPLEIYMEGNIVFRQGERVIYAQRMYYDVTNEVGTVLGAEMLTPVHSYQGLLRLRAEVIQQTGPERFFAQNAFMTSSRMGQPGYRIQSNGVYFEDQQYPALDPFTMQPLFDPTTGEPVLEHRRLATARNTLLFLGPLPVFYWPVLATDVSDPTFYIRNAKLKDDRVFGSQILTTWDMYELLNIKRPPKGTEWDASLDYLSERGFGHGTTFLYNRDFFAGIAGRQAGLADCWGIKDRGFDNLGAGRRHVAPEKDYRYRLFWQHRHELPGDFLLSAEFGWISDGNFLEQYFEREWDELKDETTGIELKRTRANMAWSVTGDVRVNDFFTQTEWLPRADHFYLGQSLLGNLLTWYEHSSAGYARLLTASPVASGSLPWGLLPWEKSVQGERLVTRQEIDLPVQLGPVKVVPYALGELAHWGEDLDGDDLQRAYCQAGVRTSLPIWRADPMIENRLFNVHGLAHKAVFDVEFSCAESNQDLKLLPLYDPLDDDSVEAFRRHLPAPQLQLDSRFYALRTGMQGWVTAPSTEIADDLLAMRMGMRHRWQTKRGMPGNRRIIDWITLDGNFTWFPDEMRDNFGKAIGLLNYDFSWHVGDRLTLSSDGIFDFFDEGQQVVNFGGFLSRPPRGNLYIGMRLLDGPVEARVLTLSYSYWMSPKWVSAFGTSVDLSGQGNIGQRFSITRIGESLLISAGFNVDAARDNVGVNLAVEPRFLPRNRLGFAGGARIPPAGAYGLE